MQTQLATPLRHLMCLRCKGKEKQMHWGRRHYKEKKKTSELEEKTIPSKSGNIFLKKMSLKSSLFFSPCFTSREREEKA